MKKINPEKKVKRCYKCRVLSPFLVKNGRVFYCRDCYEEKRLMEKLYIKMVDMDFAETTIKKMLGVENYEIIK